MLSGLLGRLALVVLFVRFAGHNMVRILAIFRVRYAILASEDLQTGTGLYFSQYWPTSESKLIKSYLKFLTLEDELILSFIVIFVKIEVI